MIKDSRQRLFEMMERVGGMPVKESEKKPHSLPPGFSEEDFTTLEKEIVTNPCDVEEAVRDFKGLGATEIDPETIKQSGREKFQAQLNKTKQGIGPEGRFSASTYRKGMDLSNVKDKKGNIIDPKKIGKEKFKVDLENIPDLDLDVIKKIILTPPPEDKLLGQNTKMKKGEMYSISMPALKAFIYDIDTEKWYVINVCRKAGECVNWCYAQMGQYVINKPPIRHRTQMLNYLINHWEEWRDKIISRIKSLSENSKGEFIVRWHDTGDFISPKYLQIAIEIAKATPNVMHYAYTKEVSAVKKLTDIPQNFEFKFSFGGVEDEKISDTDPRAYVAPQEIFADLHPKMPTDADKKEWKKGGKWEFSEEGWDTIKNELSRKYNIPRDKILTHDEYMEIPHDRALPQERKWYVIEKPGDTDIPASRKDTMAIINLEHN